MSIADKLGYSSPISKLIRFFRRSRDQWKAKCKAAKAEIKSLKIRLTKMRESRDQWKAKAQSAAQELETMKQQPTPETKSHLEPLSRGPGARGARAERRPK
jgi:chromosome segregation ATPase